MGARRVYVVGSVREYGQGAAPYYFVSTPVSRCLPPITALCSATWKDPKVGARWYISEHTGLAKKYRSR